MKTLILFCIVFSFGVIAQEKKVIYEYKKFEKFDFDAISVEGEAGIPGDLSINPRLRKEFQNQLPERPNFNKEIKHAIEGLR